MAALVLGELFSPASDPAVGTIAAFGTLAAGYVARPLGGAVFGRFGDRRGRRSMLVLTMVLMGVASVLIGVLPTYETIGVAAPVLLVLFRVVQGIAIGGEWAGATLMVVEHAAPRRRGLWSGVMQMGSPVGFLLSMLAVTLTSLLPREAFLAWGRRVPFLYSAVLPGIGPRAVARAARPRHGRRPGGAVRDVRAAGPPALRDVRHPGPLHRRPTRLPARRPDRRRLHPAVRGRPALRLGRRAERPPRGARRRLRARDGAGRPAHGRDPGQGPVGGGPGAAGRAAP
ncbi:MFS transporter [Streptomyces sp. NPDC059556]|uniref:MFS transporter n=1 Tax=Streptomyces sp. NPDC059556 TaxID=3346863 RepID=UPI0036A157AB